MASVSFLNPGTVCAAQPKTGPAAARSSVGDGSSFKDQFDGAMNSGPKDAAQDAAEGSVNDGARKRVEQKEGRQGPPVNAAILLALVPSPPPASLGLPSDGDEPGAGNSPDASMESSRAGAVSLPEVDIEPVETAKPRIEALPEGAQSNLKGDVAFALRLRDAIPHQSEQATALAPEQARPALTPRPMAASPMAVTSIAASPIAASPIAASPVAGSPMAASPVAASPIAGSPMAVTSIAASPIAARPIEATPIEAKPAEAARVRSTPAEAAPQASAAAPAAAESTAPPAPGARAAAEDSHRQGPGEGPAAVASPAPASAPQNGAGSKSDPRASGERASDNPPGQRTERQRAPQLKPAFDTAAVPAQAGGGNAEFAAQTVRPAAAATAFHSSAAEPAPRAAAASVAEPANAAPEAIRENSVSELTDISLTLPINRADSAGAERVAIRMVQRGGEIHVSVRTPDAQLSQALREDLGKLSNGLDQAGFRTETWRPAVTAAAQPGSSSAHQDHPGTASHRDGSDPDSRSGGHQGRGGGDPRRRQQEDRPRWVAELEHSRNS
ncbi:MAG TPA: hypothetical protein VL285_11880 [Bryobacteraceae bacterium]|nr:hypothetical protein [Bryobacteraceae bacterium]